MDGIHLLGEWYDCPADTPEFTQAAALRTLCIHAARDSGLTVVGDSFHQFEPQGVTGTVLLAESHIAIHTWPEAGFVTVDVYVCNLQTDNTAKAEHVFRALETALRPQRTRFQAIHRGERMPERDENAPARDVAPALMTEYLTDDWAYFLRSSRQFEKFKSPHQAIEVHDTAQFGKLFRLDGHFMTSEKDEFFYHENLVHIPAITHPQPTSALIVGGGDGGSAEELLKHPSIKSVTLCEIDLAVVDISRKYLQNVHRGAFDDARLTLKIEDGFAFVRNATEQYDLIVLDLTDAGGPSAALYTPEFYRACAARLTATGALSLHVASPIAHPDRVRGTLASLRGAFAIVTPYLTSVPLYGGLWMMACCSSSLDPKGMSILNVDRRIAQRGIKNLQYYNGDMHRAALAFPNFIRQLVA